MRTARFVLALTFTLGITGCESESTTSSPPHEGGGSFVLTPTEADWSEADCIGQTVECVGGLLKEICCVGPDCQYRFSGGMVLFGASAADGYCQGENDGSLDGNCHGPTNICDFGTPQGECESYGCTYYPEFSQCSGVSECKTTLNPDSCELKPGCNWLAPEGNECGYYDAEGCIEGRRFATCGISYRLFEDGTRLEGIGAALGYCFGFNDGSVDGDCEILDKRCDAFEDETICADADCTWSFNSCGDNHTCPQFNDTECNDDELCEWEYIEDELSGTL